MSRMGGIERNIVRKYGRAYWNQHKETILDRMHAPSYPKQYNSEVRRDMRRHPLDYREQDLRDAGMWDDPEVRAAYYAQPGAIEEAPSGAALGYDPDKEPEEEEDDDEEDEDDDEEEDDEDDEDEESEV